MMDEDVEFLRGLAIYPGVSPSTQQLQVHKLLQYVLPRTAKSSSNPGSLQACLCVTKSKMMPCSPIADLRTWRSDWQRGFTSPQGQRGS